MLTAVLKAVKMLLSYCPKNSQDVAVLTALKAVQDTEKNHLHKDQVQRLISIILLLSLVHRLVGNLDHPDLGVEL
jgi:RecJ-like exonuclease